MRKILILASIGMTMIACNNKNEETSVIKEGPVANATIVLKSGAGASTRAVTTVDGSVAEKEIKQLEVFVFNSDGSKDSKTPYFQTTALTNNRVNFGVTSGSNKKFVVVTNMNLTDAGISNYAALKAKLATLALSGANSREFPSMGMAMSGENTANIIDAVANNPVEINVTRVASKITAPNFSNVAVAIDDTQIEDLFGSVVVSQDVTFAFKGYAVVNALDKSDAFFIGNATADETAAWDLWSLTGKSRIVGVYDQNEGATKGDLLSAYTGVQNSSVWMDGTVGNKSDRVFVYENYPSIKTVNGISGHDRTTVVAFIIKGDLTYNGVTETRYWRINIVKNDLYVVKRNYIYNVIVDQIVTTGYATAEEADKDENNGGGGEVIPENGQTGIIATILVNPWRVLDQNTNI